MKFTFETNDINEAQEIFNTLYGPRSAPLAAGEAIEYPTHNEAIHPGISDDEAIRVVLGDAPSDTVDAEGLPWDHRIHSSSKERTAKNVWKRRRGVDDSVFDQVVTELKQVGAIQPAVAIPTPPPAVNTAAVFGGAAEVVEELTFPAFMRKIITAINSGQVDREFVDSTLSATYGVVNLAQLGTRPDLWAEALLVLGV